VISTPDTLAIAACDPKITIMLSAEIPARCAAGTAFISSAKMPGSLMYCDTV
jgi:hypothetical protein